MFDGQSGDCVADLFAKHFGDNKNKKSSTQSSTQKQIDERVTGGSEHWCNHIILVSHKDANQNIL